MSTAHVARRSLRQHRHASSQRGAAALEFALVLVFGGLLVLLLGVFELGRVMFTFNTASEATRLGARLAVVCDAHTSHITERMQALLPLLTPERVVIDYHPRGCASSAQQARQSCTAVTVSVAPGTRIDSVIPLVPLSVAVPPFSTTLPREAMDSQGCSDT